MAPITAMIPGQKVGIEAMIPMPIRNARPVIQLILTGANSGTGFHSNPRAVKARSHHPFFSVFLITTKPFCCCYNYLLYIYNIILYIINNLIIYIADTVVVMIYAD